MQYCNVYTFISGTTAGCLAGSDAIAEFDSWTCGLHDCDFSLKLKSNIVSTVQYYTLEVYTDCTVLYLFYSIDSQGSSNALSPTFMFLSLSFFVVYASCCMTHAGKGRKQNLTGEGRFTVRILAFAPPAWKAYEVRWEYITAIISRDHLSKFFSATCLRLPPSSSAACPKKNNFSSSRSYRRTTNLVQRIMRTILGNVNLATNVRFSDCSFR